MAMTMPMARVKRTLRVVSKELGNGRIESMGIGKGSGRQRRKGRGRGRGREMGNGMILINKLQVEMISLEPLLCSCKKICRRQMQTRRATKSGNINRWKHRQSCQFPQMMIPLLTWGHMAIMTQNIVLTWICRSGMM
jgi:hypothetical protein